jgi:hypothetical protein
MVTPWRHHDPPRVLADQRSCHEVNENEGTLKKNASTSLPCKCSRKLL